VEGVIGFDQHALQDLIGALGPLTVPGSDQVVTGATVLAFIRDSWATTDGKFDSKWWLSHKSFMATLATAAMARLDSGSLDWLALAQTGLRLLGQKHLVIYVPEPHVAALLAEQGWDGGMGPERSPMAGSSDDYLMVVDANLGYNKATALVQQAITYEVDLRSAQPQARLTLVYTHTGRAGSPCVPETRYEPQYEQMMQRCYWDYVRVFVPRGNALLEATQIPVPDDRLLFGKGTGAGQVTAQNAQEGPWQSFEALLLLPTGQSQTRYYTWTLSADVIARQADEGTYALCVKKQLGAHDHALTVRVRLPEGYVLQQVEPQPAVPEEGGWVTFRVTLAQDRQFSLRFGRQP
jgi:hypothetical protein